MGFQIGDGERGVVFFEIETIEEVFQYASLVRGNDGVGANLLGRVGPVFSILTIQREYPREACYKIARPVVP